MLGNGGEKLRDGFLGQNKTAAQMKNTENYLQILSCQMTSRSLASR